jgi:anaerobic magnesium-protoporphyrin IX monomethyl ester cyclase
VGKSSSACIENGRHIDMLFVLPWFGLGDPPIRRSLRIGVEYPITMLMLMAHLERAGFRTGIIDMSIERNPFDVLHQALKTCHPGVVGLSSYSSNVKNAAKVAALVKQANPATPVVLGGFHATALPEECLARYPGIDYIMHGEVENALPLLLNAILNGRTTDGIPNLAVRDGPRIRVSEAGPIVDLQELPFPLIEQLDFRQYVPLPTNFYSLPTMGLMSSRGCPFHCSFCATHFHWNRNVRRMPRGLLIEWLERLIRDHGVRDFRFYDDIFTIPKASIQDFCEEVIRRDLRIHWNCYSRVDTLDEESARLMKRAGCYHVKFGIEAGTEESLARIRKGITIDQAVRTVHMVKQLGIETKGSFILGIEGESFEDSMKTVELALRLDLDYATYELMSICPGSEDYARWKQAGRIPSDHAWDVPLYATSDIPRFQALLEKAVRRTYLRPRFIKNRLSALARHPWRESVRAVTACTYALSSAVRKR